MPIKFVTSNKNKLQEIRDILSVEIEQLDLDIFEIQTLDPKLCVELKAEFAYQKAKCPILVEDTALFFEAWNGLPGVFIDYFMKSIYLEGLLNLLSNEKNRRAIAQTSLCYFDGKRKITVTGKVKGKISGDIRYDNGFGWDRIFIPNGYDKAFSEMTRVEKNQISMRKLAAEKLKSKLKLITVAN